MSALEGSTRAPPRLHQGSTAIVDPTGWASFRRSPDHAGMHSTCDKCHVRCAVVVGRVTASRVCIYFYGIGPRTVAGDAHLHGPRDDVSRHTPPRGQIPKVWSRTCNWRSVRVTGDFHAEMTVCHGCMTVYMVLCVPPRRFNTSLHF